jgi:hypothetical protein
MRTPTLAALVAVLSLPPLAATAETPLNCSSGTVKRVEVSSNGTRLTIRGTMPPVVGFDPVANGLDVELSYEPETDPANLLYRVMLPTGFVPIAGGFRYRDRSGSVDGIKLVKIRGRTGDDLRIVIKRRGPALAAGLESRPLRVVLDAGGTCVRSCPSACSAIGGRLRCVNGTDTALCGLRSGCEVLGMTGGPSSRNCLLPYPSSFFETADVSTVTGRRIDYRLHAMPANTSGVHIDPTPYNLLDGFSPGPILISHFEQGVDLAASNVPQLTDFAASLDPASPTILIEADAAGCVRVDHFGENDVSLGVDNVTPIAPPNQVFMIRPGRRLKNATRYIVALRNLVDQQAQPIGAGPAFESLRDGTPSGSARVEARRPAMDAILDKLENDCGVTRADVVLAWDFTTASDDSIQRYLLHMRDETFAQLPGTTPPAFAVTVVEDDPFGDPRVCRRVQGTYEVPLWTTFNGPGSVLNIDSLTNLPVQNGVATNVPFTVMIPCSLVNPTPAAGRPIFYGHGLLGSGFGEVTAGNLRTLADTYGFVIAATDWQGFSSADVPAIVGFIGELSGFPKLSERLHQGVLNQLVLARLLVSPTGLVSDPAFQYGGVPIIDTSEVFYYGNSQGGIEGGPVMALSQDATRGVLGVAAANYSTLLQRSRDFEPFFALLKLAYPDDVDRALGYPLLQQLWDRSEPNGWYHHTIPGTLPNTPAHKVLVHMARSDAEVANLGTEIMVRSMGIPQVAPVGYSYFDIAEMAAPFDGSAMVESDFGEPDPPITNTPPADNGVHGAMRALPEIQAQIDQFLRNGGNIQNFCAGPCDPN